MGSGQHLRALELLDYNHLNLNCRWMGIDNGRDDELLVIVDIVSK